MRTDTVAAPLSVPVGGVKKLSPEPAPVGVEVGDAAGAAVGVEVGDAVGAAVGASVGVFGLQAVPPLYRG